MIEPIDIKTQHFKKALIGYNTEEVKLFVEGVYRAYEELYNSHKELSKNVETLNKSLQESRIKLFELECSIQKENTIQEKVVQEKATVNTQQPISNMIAEFDDEDLDDNKTIQLDYNKHSNTVPNDFVQPTPNVEPEISDEPQIPLFRRKGSTEPIKPSIKFEPKGGITQIQSTPSASTTQKPKEDSDFSATSRFFKKAEDSATSSPIHTANSDEDEILVGEIEDVRRHDRMMIGDGEEDEDFEFL